MEWGSWKNQEGCGCYVKQLGMDKNDIEKLLKKIPKELTNEEFLELEEKEHIAEKEAKQNETAGEVK